MNTIVQYDWISIVSSLMVLFLPIIERFGLKQFIYDENNLSKDVLFAKNSSIEKHVKKFKRILNDYERGIGISDTDLDESIKEYSEIIQKNISDISAWDRFVFEVRCAHNYLMYTSIMGIFLLAASIFSVSIKNGISCFFIFISAIILFIYQAGILLQLRNHGNYIKDNTELYKYVVGK